MVSFQSKSGPDELEIEEDPLDARVAMSDWDARFAAWQAEKRQEEKRARAARHDELQAMLKARRTPEFLKTTPITQADEFEMWNPAFTDQTVADMKRLAQGLPPRVIPKGPSVPTSVFRHIPNPVIPKKE